MDILCRVRGNLTLQSCFRLRFSNGQLSLWNIHKTNLTPGKNENNWDVICWQGHRGGADTAVVCYSRYSWWEEMHSCGWRQWKWRCSTLPLPLLALRTLPTNLGLELFGVCGSDEGVHLWHSQMPRTSGSLHGCSSWVGHCWEGPPSPFSRRLSLLLRS